MNGGTNIALAVQKAGQLLKPLGPATHRVLALLTDGRIDSHQVGWVQGQQLPRCSPFASRVCNRTHVPRAPPDLPVAPATPLAARYGFQRPARPTAGPACPTACLVLLPLLLPQSREAADMAARLGDEQARVRLHAYGVGRGVDREELLRIIGGREPHTAVDRRAGGGGAHGAGEAPTGCHRGAGPCGRCRPSGTSRLHALVPDVHCEQLGAPPGKIWHRACLDSFLDRHPHPPCLQVPGPDGPG